MEKTMSKKLDVPMATPADYKGKYRIYSAYEFVKIGEREDGSHCSAQEFEAILESHRIEQLKKWRDS